jgi:hypothetical protein
MSFNIKANASINNIGVWETIEQEVINSDKTLEENEVPIETYYDGWTKTRVNVREKPDINSNILNILDFNSYIYYTAYDDNWVKINYEGGEAYIAKQYISGTECPYQEYTIPAHDDFKSYMGYELITDQSSNQYFLQDNHAYTGNYGIRMVGNRYCVAVGSYFNTEIGQYFDLVLENGIIIPCVMGDLKADKDTDSSNIFTSNGCCSEFIVDSATLHSTAKLTGNISDLNENWNSPVIKIKVYSNNILN